MTTAMVYGKNRYTEKILLSLPFLVPLCLIAYIGGSILLIGIVVVLPALLVAGMVSLVGIVISYKKRSFALSSLFVIPVFLAALIGFAVDTYRTNKRVDTLTAIYHEAYEYKATHGQFPQSLESLNLKGVSLKEVHYSADSTHFYIQLFDAEMSSSSPEVYLKGRP